MWVVIREGLNWYAWSWLGGFEWPIFVGVDAFHTARRAANVGGRSGVV